MPKKINPKKINIKVQGKQYSIPLDDIVYLEKDLRRIRAYTRRYDITFYGRFCEYEPYLDERFAMCHRSYILNMDEIVCLDLNGIVMSNGDIIRFGLKCYEKLTKMYNNYSIRPERRV
ncbi:MAG: LytTR family DNA-binding domain-containing protein [Bacillota bacterium]|nr:LytTR family DNA-binding domain-containing protein [Bacillota bacterium]